MHIHIYYAKIIDHILLIKQVVLRGIKYWIIKYLMKPS